MTTWIAGVDSVTKRFPAQVETALVDAVVTPAAAAAAAGKVDKGAIRISVLDSVGATPGAKAVAAALAAPAGSILYFPPETYVNPAGKGNGITVANDNVTLELAPGAEIQVNTWGQAGIDLIGRSGCQVLGGSVRYTGTRVTAGSGSYRGSNETSGTAGVWINKDRCVVDGLRTVNMPVAVYLSSWNGSTSQDRQGVGNAVRNVECEGMDFGVLWTGQKGLRISNVVGHDDVDDSGGTNPTHVLYGASNTSAFPSDDVVISECIAQNLLTGHAFQFKYHTNSKAKNLVARDSVGVLSVLGCTDSDFDVSLVGAKETAISPQGWVVSQDASTARLKITADIAVDAVGADHRAVHFFGADSKLDLNLVTRRKSNAAASTAEVRVLGPGNRARVKVKNLSAFPAPAVQVGDSSNDSTGTRVDIDSVSGCSRLVDFYSSGGGVVVYERAEQSLTSSTFVSTQSGSPSYRVRENGVLTGSGSPEGVVTDVVGAIYKRADGVAGSAVYIKETGSGNTGWRALAQTSADVQTFTADGTWTKPTGAKSVTATVIAGGAGGGSGARDAAGTARAGGAGGGGGGFTMMTLDASVLGSTESVVVGAGGAGGASQTANTTAGNAGSNGGSSRFGVHAFASRGTGGAGGGLATAATAGAAGTGLSAGGAGGGGSGAGAAGGVGAAGSGGGPGGGGGGGLTTGNVESAGGAGGTPPSASRTAGTAGTTSGGAGGSGSSATAGTGSLGAGGGGGGSSAAGAGGAGGNGGSYGAGGGGGGASVNGQASGAGGNGAPGVVVVVTYF